VELSFSVFSPAQLFGYAAFAFGVACFLQKNDLRLKALLSLECLSCVVHFWLLGNPTAAGVSAVSVTRSLVSMRSRSAWVAFAFMLCSAGMGLWLGTGWLSVLPVAASCVGTSALFLFSGIRMRLLMLVGASLWLTNNIVSGSIGGTLLELMILSANSWTIWRLHRDRHLARADASP
jgi:hypothetical protein